LINDLFPKSHRTKAFFGYQIFGTFADMLTRLTVAIIQIVGWQWCYVSCGALGIAAGVIGLIVIPEPPNSAANKALRRELEELKGKSVHKKKENLVWKIFKSYGHGFVKIFGSLAASLCLLGIFAR
jgi:MFS family permease